MAPPPLEWLEPDADAVRVDAADFWRRSQDGVVVRRHAAFAVLLHEGKEVQRARLEVDRVAAHRVREKLDTMRAVGRHAAL